jgi:hypothetical protein
MTGASGKVTNNGTSAEVSITAINNQAQWGPFSVSSSAAYTAANVIYFHLVSDVDL